MHSIQSSVASMVSKDRMQGGDDVACDTTTLVARSARTRESRAAIALRSVQRFGGAILLSVSAAAAALAFTAESGLAQAQVVGWG
jgi:hypothetical protein